MLLLATALFVAGLVEAPLSLTTSDGAGLKLVSLDADAVCGGPMCFTELRLAFENPEDRVIEGQFQIALPPGASVSRFAMKMIDGRWQEAEVVEKQAARRAYEDFLHRRQDPALLEQAAGNQFQARVFPIPARGKKELVIGYGHALAATSAPYVLPLAGLPQIEKLKVRVRASGAQDGELKEIFALDKARFVPSADAVVLVPGARAVRSEDVVVMRAAPAFPSAAETGNGPIMVLVDTSASRALQMKKDVTLVTALLRELASTGSDAAARQAQVVAFDQTIELAYSGALGGFDATKLAKRKALGATDLAAALAYAANASPAVERVIVVTDGVETAELGVSVADVLKQLKARGVGRVDAIVRGGVRDEAALATIVRAGKREGMVIDGDLAVKDIASKLSRVARSGITVDVAGAVWVWPKALDGVQPGDERVIIAELPAKAPLALKLGGVAVDVGAAGRAPAPLLRRAWAEAKIARAQSMLAATTTAASKKEIKEQIVTLSTKHRVLSSETALLILETEEDYARYGIDRKSLADILAVDERGLTLISRKDVVVPKKDPPPPLVKKKPAKNEKSKDKEAAKRDITVDMDAAENLNGEGEPQPDDGKPEAKEEEDAPDAKKLSDDDESDSRRGPPPAPPPPPPPRAEAPSPTTTAPMYGLSASEPEPDKPMFINPWTGPFDAGMKLLAAGKRDEALKKAHAWREEQPGDVLALLLLAEVLAEQNPDESARALGAIIDLFPSRTDLRRAVGARLDKLAAANNKSASKSAGALSVDTWRRSVEQRPDHPQSHRGLAWALVRQGSFAEAFAASESALAQKYRGDSFRGVDRILREDLGLIGAAWRAHGGKAAEIDARIKKAGGTPASAPSLRFVLWWETDSNDVDFHIRDGKNNHAYYSSPKLASGGELYADVTTGYGPECFTIPGKQRTAPYALSAHYYSRGPMGFGLGTLLVIDHDGKGNFTFSDRPFVIMVDGAFVDLGSVAGR